MAQNFERELLPPYESPAEVNRQRLQLLRELLEAESQAPLDMVTVMCGMVVVVCALQLLSGGAQRFPSVLGMQCSSVTNWALTAVVLAAVVALIHYLLRSAFNRVVKLVWTSSDRQQPASHVDIYGVRDVAQKLR
ncbi:unnamed protein product [Sphagnum balticum]